jgi:hypothetical protein
METLDAVESIDPKVYGVLVVDSITPLWEAARASNPVGFTGRWVRFTCTSATLSVRGSVS